MSQVFRERKAPSLDEALARPMESEGIPVAPPEVLVAMKLIAGRPQDDVDVEKLLEVVDVDKVRAYVAEHAPDYVEVLVSTVVVLVLGTALWLDWRWAWECTFDAAKLQR